MSIWATDEETTELMKPDMLDVSCIQSRVKITLASASSVSTLAFRLSKISDGSQL
jgi:hypothetical protein